jgi:hypothetical protein
MGYCLVAGSCEYGDEPLVLDQWNNYQLFKNGLNHVCVYLQPEV